MAVEGAAGVASAGAAPTPAAAPAPAAAASPQQQQQQQRQKFPIKRVQFFGRSVKVCMQNENGPCPLLAIANVLSLRNELKLPTGIKAVTQGELVTAIVDLLLERSKHYAAAYAADMEHSIAEIFPVLEKLTTGVDVNVKFHSIHAFEPTPEVAVFDLLGIPLVHGWLVDPQDRRSAAVFGNRSYNELVELMFLVLGDEEMELLSCGPLRKLSISSHHMHSFSSAAGSPLAAAAAAAAAASAGSGLQSAGSGAAPAVSRGQSFSGNGSTAAAAGAALPPQQQQRLQGIRVQGDACSQPQAAAAAGDAAAVDSDAEIEGLVADMLQDVCSELGPGAIELGDSPTREAVRARQLAYAGPGPSRLGAAAAAGASSSDDAAATSAAAAGAAAAADSSPAAAAAGAGSGSAQRPAASPADAAVVRAFMEAHASQLTPYGLACLKASPPAPQLPPDPTGAAASGTDGPAAAAETASASPGAAPSTAATSSTPSSAPSTDLLKDHALAVFFRNNHFNALFKYEGAVYLLVTDQGYEYEPDIVWERLDSVNGDTTFCGSGFEPFVPHRDAAAGAGAAGGAAGAAATDLDAAIAASLAVAGGGGSDGGQLPCARGGGSDGGGAQQHQADADFALALQLQLQEEEAVRLRQEREAAQQQQRSQQQPQQQQPQQQQQPEPLAAFAASMRSASQRVTSGLQNAAAALTGEPVPQQQQQQQPPRHPHHHGGRRPGSSGGGAGRKPGAAEDKCSIM